MATDAPPSLAVPEAGRPSPRGSHNKKVVKRKPCESGRSVQTTGAASVVEVLTELNSGGRSQAGREARLSNLTVANRADRLQVNRSFNLASLGTLTLNRVYIGIDFLLQTGNF